MHSSRPARRAGGESKMGDLCRRAVLEAQLCHSEIAPPVATPLFQT